MEFHGPRPNRQLPPDVVGAQAEAQTLQDLDLSTGELGVTRELGYALIESVALDGSGVREAFVFAVRLALDRVREEQRLGALPALGAAQQESALLAELRTLEHAAPKSRAGWCGHR